MDAATPPEKPELAISASRHLIDWMASRAVSLGLSTYQAGKLFLVGVQPNGRLSVYERTFNRCMGLHASADGQTLWMASLYQLWRLENYVPTGQATSDGYDALYVPTLGHTTGDVDVHDIVVPQGQAPVFCVTAFNCIATVSHTHSFKPVWSPSFIGAPLSAPVGEDRCHLNGLAGDPATGEPRYATAVSKSDVADGWRDRRDGGGVLIDVRSGDIVAEGLSMPHSPRMHPAHPDKVWLVNAGTGFFGYVDLKSGSFENVAFCPGFARGLTFEGEHAVVGLSAARKNRTFEGLPLQENLKAKDAEARCALHVINLATGTTDHWLRLEGVVRELYDVITLPGVRRPMLLGFKSDEIRRMLRIEEP